MSQLLLTTPAPILAGLPALPAAGGLLLLLSVLVLVLLIGVLLVTGQLMLHLRQQAPLPTPAPPAAEPVGGAASPVYSALQESAPEASAQVREQLAPSVQA